LIYFFIDHSNFRGLICVLLLVMIYIFCFVHNILQVYFVIDILQTCQPVNLLLYLGAHLVTGCKSVRCWWRWCNL